MGTGTKVPAYLTSCKFAGLRQDELASRMRHFLPMGTLHKSVLFIFAVGRGQQTKCQDPIVSG